MLLLSIFVINTSAAALPEGGSALLSNVFLQGGRQVQAPTQDGAITADEYVSTSVVPLGQGLTLTSFGGDYKQDPSSLSASGFLAEETVCLSYDGSYFYIGLSLHLSSSTLLAPYRHPRFGDCYFVSFSIGISPHGDLYQKTAYLTNQYYFSAGDYRCLAMSGTRIRRASDGEKQALYRLNDPAENAYTDDRGAYWDSSRYRDDVAYSLVREGDCCHIILEARVPRGDLMRTLSSRDASAVASILDSERDPYFVSFTSEFSLAELAGPAKGEAPFALCLGFPVTDICPYSENGESWQEYLLRLEPNSANCTPVLPLAVYLVGSPPSKLLPTDQVPPASVGKDDPAIPSPSVTASTDIPSDSSSTLSDEFLSYLPDPDAVLPENEEILYDESDFSNSKNGEESSIFGGIVTVAASILLFLSVIAAAILFRIREKKEEKTKKSLKKDK